MAATRIGSMLAAPSAIGTFAPEAASGPNSEAALPTWGLGPFEKLDTYNPCLLPRGDTFFQCPHAGPVAWEEKDVFNPAVVVCGGKVCLLYRAEDRIGSNAGTSRIGLAESQDGRLFERHLLPVLYPDRDPYHDLEWDGGCEDPRIVEDESGKYFLTYTAFDGKVARLCVATSTDLRVWHKHGPVFLRAEGGKYRDLWSKSGSIVVRREGARLVAHRIDGRYWMYWGESDVFAAHSEDLIEWTPHVGVVDENTRVRHLDGRYEVSHFGGTSAILPVIPRRLRRFDSTIVEPGPPALYTDSGIVLLYNGKNHPELGDARLAPRSYSVGQALFDPRDPACLIARTNEPFLVPDRRYEIEGQIEHVCFAQGLVYFNGEWLLYYGTADSKIAVARAAA